MNVLITNIWLVYPAGTEVYVRDLSIALHKHGVHVEVYSPFLGRIAEQIRKAGILVVSSTEELIEKPDIIHAHHFFPTLEAIVRFPDVPIIYFLHDRTHFVDIPPRYPRILKYIAVDYNCLDRLLVDSGIPKEITGVMYNWVDTERFKQRQNFSKKPLKALVFSNYASNTNYYKTVEKACQMAGIELDAIGGGMGKMMLDPEKLLGQYDIVFAKAKAAMEALATGAAVILCDFRGLGGMVSSVNFDKFRRLNFGWRTLTREIEAETIYTEIRKYHPNECKALANRIEQEASLDKFVTNILKLYKDTIANDTHEPVEKDLLFGSLAHDYRYAKKIFYQFKIERQELKFQEVFNSNIELKEHYKKLQTAFSKLENQQKLLQEKVQEQQIYIKEQEQDYSNIIHSKAFKIGRALTFPIRKINESRRLKRERD